MTGVSGSVYLRKGERGSSWYYRARLPHETRKRLGPAYTGKGRPPVGYFTRKSAQAALDAVLTDARRGTLQGVAATGGANFADASAEWLRYVEHDRKRRASTVADYKGLVAFALDPEFGSLPLAGVTMEKIDAYRARLVEDGKLSARTINKRLVALHGILRRAMRVYGLRTNAAALVDRQPLRRTGEFNVLSPAEVEALARAAADEQDAALFRVAAFTGLRLGELRALRWCDVDFGKHLVHVRRNFTHGANGAPKSGRVRSVPLIDQAAKALEDLSRREYFTGDDDLVFVDQVGGHLDDTKLRRRFHDALDLTGLKRLRLHDLRHTFGTLAVQVWPLSDVRGYMGHADIATTMIYAHHVPQADAAEKLSRLVAASDGLLSAVPTDGEQDPLVRRRDDDLRAADADIRAVAS